MGVLGGLLYVEIALEFLTYFLQMIVCYSVGLQKQNANEF